MSKKLVYISSKGEEIDPEELHLARFGNGIRLIEREGSANPNFSNLEALREVFTRRQAAWDEEHPDQAQHR